MALPHAILVSLCEQSGSGYELARRFDRSIGYFWAATHQQIYRTLKSMEDDGWVAFFCTDPEASVADLLAAVADRGSLEQAYHDLKEVWGAGQQQLRRVWANVGAWNLIGWWHTLVELWAWDRPASRSCDRSDSPWDQAERRPSHANRCQQLRREALQEEYSRLPSVAGVRPKIRRFIQRLIRAAA